MDTHPNSKVQSDTVCRRKVMIFLQSHKTIYVVTLVSGTVLKSIKHNLHNTAWAIKRCHYFSYNSATSLFFLHFLPRLKENRILYNLLKVMLNRVYFGNLTRNLTILRYEDKTVMKNLWESKTFIHKINQDISQQKLVKNLR